MLCIGCEMVQTDRGEAEWRTLVAEVRAVYDGLVTSTATRPEDHVG